MTTILVVEDEALIADDIQRTLTRLGYEVPTPAATAAEALAGIASSKPDLVLIDIKLRGTRDGIEAGGEIRSRFGLPIIYLTSQSDDATIARAKETTPHGYVLKPFDERELRIGIEVALHKHKIESRLAVRERWFSTTLRSVGDAVIATDQSDIITFMNAVAERLTGWGTEATGRPLVDVFVVLDEAGEPLERPRLAKMTPSFTVEATGPRRLLIRTGDHIPIDESVAPIIDDDGTLLGGVIVFRDITERRKLEQRAAQSERLAAIGTMALSMAHEINNPLAYVTANLTFSLESLVGSAADADVVEALREAAEGAERMRRIVLNFRRLGRADDSSPTVLDLPDVLDISLKMTAHATRHHARTRKVLGLTPYVLADETELGQVFSNLLLNAAQAIDDGHADTNEIVITTFTDGAGRAIVQISDSGPGIPLEVLPRIFDPFFTTKPAGAGMGIGLAICQRIVTALGGEITASNALGGGAVFTVAIPSAPQPEPRAEVHAKPAPPGARGRVLIIDDELAVATALSRSLRGHHDVQILTSGREAVALIETGERFDVIFCDLMMPSFSGMDVHETLSASCPEQARRVVFMTGGAFTERASRFLASVTNPRHAKPFTVEGVRATVREALKS